jgi:hypothetical protein
MGASTSNNSLQIIAPLQKKRTVIRNNIPAKQRLSATLHLLVTGQAFEDLKFTATIVPQTLTGIPLFLMCPA